MENLIEKYNNLQKEILSSYSLKWNDEKSKSTFRSDVMRVYGFEKEFGWNIILNAYYIIDDTELAKKSFEIFTLQGPSRYRDIGERYLRLYGFLNSIYQQKLAVENLMEVHKIRKKTEYSSELTNNDLLVLRNKIAAHSANYNLTKIDSEHKFDVYEISRLDLQADRIRLLRNQTDFEEYEIARSIKEYDSLIVEILSVIVGKVIKKLFNNQGKFYFEYQRLNKLKNGAILLGDSTIVFK